MATETFVTDAVRTESRIDQVVVNPLVFTEIASIIIALGSILDQIKKHTFYKKPYNTLQIRNHLDTAHHALGALRDNFQYRWPMPQGEKVVAVNPRYFHSVVGIVTEAVELLEALDLNSRDVDTVNLLEEFGDLAWYQAIGIDEAGGSLDQVLDRVIAKLRARYPEKFTSENAINRDLVRERNVLEGKE